jgi:hypothetical protein
MKSAKLVYSIAILLTFLGISQNVFALLNGEKKDSFEKTYNVSLTGAFSLSGYDSDIEIFVWDKPEVKVVGEMVYSEGSKDDENKLLKAFKSIEAKTSSGSIILNTEFIKSQEVFFGKSTITLSNGDKISLSKVKTFFQIWMPPTMALDLKSKYNNVSIQDLKGEVNFYLYDVDVVMGNFGGVGVFDMKYSNLKAKNGGKVKLTLYDTDVEMGEVADVSIDTKYSTVAIAKGNNIKVLSYDDDFVLGVVNSIVAEAKYSSFRIDNDINDAKFEIYDTDITGKGFKSMLFTAKYSKLTATTIGTFTIPSSFDNSFYISAVNELNCNEAKYDSFEIGEIATSANFNTCFDSDIKVKGTGKKFTTFSGDFKYGKVHIGLYKDLNFKLKFESTYGDISFPKGRVKVNLNSDKSDSKWIFEGSTATETSCSINFKSYSVSFTID